jgi:hypothetical protein
VVIILKSVVYPQLSIMNSTLLVVGLQEVKKLIFAPGSPDEIAGVEVFPLLTELPPPTLL